MNFSHEFQPTLPKTIRDFWNAPDRKPNRFKSSIRSKVHAGIMGGGDEHWQIKTRVRLGY